MADLDHRYMDPPYVRVVETYPCKGQIVKWDWRMAVPNEPEDQVPPDVAHTFEHCFNHYMRANNTPVVLAAPLGCLTGLYLVAADLDDFDEMAELVAGALEFILEAIEVPVANLKDCGGAVMHNLVGAQKLARKLLDARSTWHQALRDPAPAAERVGTHSA